VVVTPRTLKRGDVEFVTATIIELTGADISECVYWVAHVLDSQKNDDQATYPWEAPHAESGAVTDSVYQVKKLVTAALVNNTKTKYRVFVKVVDSPETDAVDCGTYTVMP
jgi:hypothetical protein